MAKAILTDDYLEQKRRDYEELFRDVDDWMADHPEIAETHDGFCKALDAVTSPKRKHHDNHA